jgi:hypothetical protein
MGKIITHEENAHWYDGMGEPRHEATMKEARELGLLPSPTSVSKNWRKPYVETWQLNEALKVALARPQMDPEDVTRELAEEIKDEVYAKSREASERGHKVHELNRRQLSGQIVYFDDLEDDILALYEPVYHWIKEHVVSGIAETVYVNKFWGYAGTIDWWGNLTDWPGTVVMLDWKTQGIKKCYKRGPMPLPDGTPKFLYPEGQPHKIMANFYDEWPWQLGAYVGALTDTMSRQGATVPERIQCGSVVISTNPEFPGIAIKWWSDAEIVRGWRVFLNLLSAWRLINDFPYGDRYELPSDYTQLATAG